MDKTQADRILEFLAARCRENNAEPEGFGMIGAEVADSLQLGWQEAIIAIDQLLDKGLVQYDPGDGIVRLTLAGYKAAGKRK